MRDDYNKMSRIFFVYRNFNICYSINMSRGRTCKKQVLSHLISKCRSCKESKMVYYNCVRYPMNCRMSTTARYAKNKKFEDFIEEFFGQETQLTKEDVRERLKSVNSVYSFARVMRFLCKQRRVMR